MSRKKEAESIEVTASIMGFDFCEDETLKGGRADKTLPFKIKKKTLVLNWIIISVSRINGVSSKHELPTAIPRKKIVQQITD